MKRHDYDWPPPPWLSPIGEPLIDHPAWRRVERVPPSMVTAVFEFDGGGQVEFSMLELLANSEDGAKATLARLFDYAERFAAERRRAANHTAGALAEADTIHKITPRGTS